MSICRECWKSITADQPAIQCPSCGVFYHQSCWNKNGGCIAADCGYRGAPVAVAPAQEAAPAPQHVCRKCGTPFVSNQYVCTVCGTPRRRGDAYAQAEPAAPAQVQQCPGCGAELVPNQRFCGKCGFTLQQPQQPVYQPEVPVYPQQPVYQLEQPAYPQQPVYQPEQPVYPQQPDEMQQPEADQKPQKKKTPGKALGVIGMILGILSLVLCWYLCFGFIFGLIGLILSIISKKKGCGGVATAGIVMSAIGMGIGLIFSIIWVIGFATAASLSNYNTNYYGW